MKIYKRYELEKTLSLISQGKVKFFNNKCLTFAQDILLEWDMVLGTSITKKLPKQISCVSSFGNKIAVGMVDGSVTVFEGNQTTLFNGHSRAITVLEFDSHGQQLISGSADTDIVLWDLVSEQGLSRLKGHKDQVTAAKFIHNYVISASKDSTVKIWDLDQSICIETCLEHRHEVWGLDFISTRHGLLLISGGSDGAARVFKLDIATLDLKLKEMVQQETEIKKGLTLLGMLHRTNNEKINSIAIKGDFIGVGGVDRIIEVFKIRSEKESKKLLAKKQKKSKNNEIVELAIHEEISSHCVIRNPSKVKSFDFGQDSKHLKVLVGLANNTVCVQLVDLKETLPARQQTVIDLPGHRTDIRTLSFNSDDSQLISGCDGELKLWSTDTGSCLSTFDSGYALCSFFLPGNKHVAIGTKSGTIELYELSSVTMIESIDAHQGPVWSLSMLPDKTGFASGSADQSVKFWQFAMVQDPEYSAINKRPTILHTKSLLLGEDVLCIKVSPDGKLLACALLDMTVKIFYMDSLKFFLSLYGHKLPVVSLDISFDSRKIITGSSDKSIKIWGLDFGDCHKSLQSHTDSVMQVKFVWGTHYFFSTSKDGETKYWDGDTFELLSTLKGHFGEVWALDVGKYGSLVVTGSHDRSIRIWHKTEEQFVVSEEREAELEELYEKMELEGREQEHDEKQVTKMTTESMKAGELLAESIQVWLQEDRDEQLYLQKKKEGVDIVKPPRNVFWKTQNAPDLSPSDSLLFVVSKVRTSHLGDALLTLPFTMVTALLKASVNWARHNKDPVVVMRVITFLLKNYHNEICATGELKSVIDELRASVRNNLEAERSLLRYNLSALKFMKKRQDDACVYFGGQQTEPESKRGEKRKRLVTVS